MEINYRNQFDDDPIDQIPDLNREYYLTEYRKSYGFTYISKLLRLIDTRPEFIDLLSSHIKDVHINIKIDDMTLLHYVCHNYKSDMLPKVVKILIRAGINVNENEIDYYSSTALHLVCHNYKSDKLQEVVQLLLDAGADVNAINIFVSRAIGYIFEDYESYKSPVVEILIKAGS